MTNSIRHFLVCSNLLGWRSWSGSSFHTAIWTWRERFLTEIECLGPGNLESGCFLTCSTLTDLTSPKPEAALLYRVSPRHRCWCQYIMMQAMTSWTAALLFDHPYQIGTARRWSYFLTMNLIMLLKWSIAASPVSSYRSTFALEFILSKVRFLT